MYPYRSACPTSVGARLIGAAKKDLVLAGYTNRFPFTQQSDLPRTFRELSARGVRIRFLIGDPEGSANS
ncbi:hypothetical protein [Streptomyces sp. NPDC091278]|uniref:hypothetical protein n=1 Tax=unclassified Streptomyces TaxID=2593676 RepID=UPI00344D4DB1